VSDELERRLRDFPSEFPRPDEHSTRRAENEIRRGIRRPKRRRRVSLGAALLAALAVGAAIGSVSTSASNATVTIGVRPSIVRFSEKPEIFGAVLTVAATVIENGARLAVFAPSVTEMPTFAYVPALPFGGVPESRPVALSKFAHDGLLMMPYSSFCASLSAAVGWNE